VVVNSLSMKVPKLLSILAGGDLRSDGRSQEVVEKVLSNPSLLPEVIKGLSIENDMIRGRTADVLEKVARIHYRLYPPYLSLLLDKAREDEVYMVRFHLAMLLGYLEVEGKMKKEVVDTLFDLLNDDSVFVQSWSIVSLTIIGLSALQERAGIVEKIRPLLVSNSIAVRRKAENAIAVLDGKQPLPKGWVKKRERCG
jgi:HEAT repeat protein